MRALPGVLRVFVTTGCRGCKRALELAEWVREVEPRLEVQVVEISVEPDAGAKLVLSQLGWQGDRVKAGDTDVNDALPHSPPPPFARPTLDPRSKQEVRDGGAEH